MNNNPFILNPIKMAEIENENADVSASVPTTDDGREELPPPPSEVIVEEVEDIGETAMNNADEPKTDEPKAEPKVKENENGTYKGLFFQVCDHAKRIETELRKMAENDQELADAIAEGKRTFDGCDRFIRNNMADLARELGKKEVVFDDDSVHEIARLYMMGVISDVKSAVAQTTTKPKEEKKAEKKKTKKESSKVVPLTPQIASLFDDF